MSWVFDDSTGQWQWSTPSGRLVNPVGATPEDPGDWERNDVDGRTVWWSPTLDLGLDDEGNQVNWDEQNGWQWSGNPASPTGLTRAQLQAMTPEQLRALGLSEEQIQALAAAKEAAAAKGVKPDTATQAQVRSTLGSLYSSSNALPWAQLDAQTRGYEQASAHDQMQMLLAERNAAIEQQKLAMMNARTAQDNGVSLQELHEKAREFDITTDVGRQQFADTLGLEYSKFREMQYQFDDNSARSWAALQHQNEMDFKNFDEAARQYDLTNATQRKQFQADLDYKYAVQQNQLYQFSKQMGFQQWVDQNQFAIQRDQMAEASRQFDLTTEIGQRQFAGTLGLNYNQLAETARQFDVSTATGQQQFTQKLAFDKMQSDRQFQVDSGNLQARHAELAQGARQFDISTQTGRYEFAATYGLDSQKLEETAREFDAQTAEGQRQFDITTAVGQDQFTKQLAANQEIAQGNLDLARANAILGAPRGPADIWAYSARLQGIEQAGLLGETMGQSLEAQTGESLNSLQQGPVLSNSQFATDMVLASEGQPVSDATLTFLNRTLGVQDPTVQQQNDLAAQQQKQQVAASAAQPATAATATGTPAATAGEGFLAGTPVRRSDQRGITSPPSVTPEAGPTTPIAAANQAVGQAQGSALAAAQAPPPPTTSVPMPLMSTGFQTSAQEFGKLDPTLQEMTLGLAEEQGVNTQEDFLAGLARGAPRFQPSTAALLG